MGGTESMPARDCADSEMIASVGKPPLRLYSHTWPVTSPKALVFISHGGMRVAAQSCRCILMHTSAAGEHCRRFDHVADAFNKLGFYVSAHDHRRLHFRD